MRHAEASGLPGASHGHLFRSVMQDASKSPLHNTKCKAGPNSWSRCRVQLIAGNAHGRQVGAFRSIEVMSKLPRSGKNYARKDHARSLELRHVRPANADTESSFGPLCRHESLLTWLDVDRPEAPTSP